VKLLLAEDDPLVVGLLAEALRARGHELDCVTLGADARRAVDRGAYDLIILGTSLSDSTGLQLCSELRKAGPDLRILLLTARDAAAERVAGLDAGADDCVGQPFAVEELLARVQALGRRLQPRKTQRAGSFGDIEIDVAGRACKKRGEAILLTRREFDLLALLISRDGQVIPRDELLERVWGQVTAQVQRSLDVLVTRLRRKLDDTGGPSVIRTIRTVGYAWDRPASPPQGSRKP
jgi:DNA-binding response OmpR family regulator